MRSDDYQSLAKAYDYGHKRFSGGRKIVSEDEINLIKEWISLYRQSSQNIFLDLGAGTGRITRELLIFRPQTVYALDSSTFMLDYLKKKLKKPLKQKLLQTLHASSEEIPLENESIDIVTSLHLFKHLSNPNHTVSEVGRVLKKNGYFIFDTLNKNSLIQLRKVTCFTANEKQIEDLLQKNGLEARAIVYLHVFGETIYGFLSGGGGNLLHLIDLLIKRVNLKIGTKIFILAQKHG